MTVADQGSTPALPDSAPAEAPVSRVLPITARALLWKLIFLYLEGSGAAVVVTFFLVLVGLEFSLYQWMLIWGVAFVVFPSYVVIDVFVIRRHYKPVGDALRRIEQQSNPSSEDVSRAIVRALNLPYLSFIRVTFIHGPLASGLLILGILVTNRLFDGNFQSWQIIAFAATVLFFASPAHAILEYFAIARIVVRLVEQLWQHCRGIEQAHQAELIAIRLRNKLLYLSVFIAALPLFILRHLDYPEGRHPVLGPWLQGLDGRDDAASDVGGGRRPGLHGRRAGHVDPDRLGSLTLGRQAGRCHAKR